MSTLLSIGNADFADVVVESKKDIFGKSEHFFSAAVAAMKEGRRKKTEKKNIWMMNKNVNRKIAEKSFFLITLTNTAESDFFIVCFWICFQ